MYFIVKNIFVEVIMSDKLMVNLENDYTVDPPNQETRKWELLCCEIGKEFGELYKVIAK